MSNIDQLNDIDYELPPKGKSKWILGSLALFIITLFLYFPISNKIKRTIKKQLTSIPGCPLNYDDVSFELFLPKVVIKDLNIPSKCFGNQASFPLKLQRTLLHFRFFSLSPFGLHFMLETKLINENFAAYLTVGLQSIAVNIRDNQIDMKVLSLLLPDLKMKGKVKIDTLLKLDNGELIDLKLNLRSKNLVIPPQKVKSFVLSKIELNDFLLKAKMETSKLLIQDIILGDMNSPIRSSFKGHINLSTKDIKRSTIDLKGEVKFSNSFIEKYGIIKLFMSKFDKKDEFYQVQLKGPITNPTTSSER